MKIGLVNLCTFRNFPQEEQYESCISFLEEEKIDYEDFTAGADHLTKILEKFHEALNSSVDLLWFVHGGLKCIQALPFLDFKNIKKSGKKFYGASDFTHFSTLAVFHGIECYYGQTLSRIKEYFPTRSERQFIADFLKTGKLNSLATPLMGTKTPLPIYQESLVGGHLFIFSFLQQSIQINLLKRHLFLEYHHSVLGETLEDLGYYIDQLLFTLQNNNNFPQSFILGRTELKNKDGSLIELETVNDYMVKKLSHLQKPIYFLDHYRAIVPFK